jgi:mitogen-activated protein kinase kinase
MYPAVYCALGLLCSFPSQPERIRGESLGVMGTYTVASDVWSLGLSIIEFTLGHYPYPPETYKNVFAQLQAIVHGDPPALPDGYSDDAVDFVNQCLNKSAELRPTYAEMLVSRPVFSGQRSRDGSLIADCDLKEHPFLKADSTRHVDMAGWVERAMAFREEQSRDSSSQTPTPSSAGRSSPAEES